MMKNAKLEAARYAVTEEQLNQFEKVVQHIEVQFEGYIFNVCEFFIIFSKIAIVVCVLCFVILV